MNGRRYFYYATSALASIFKQLVVNKVLKVVNIRICSDVIVLRERAVLLIIIVTCGARVGLVCSA